MIVAVASDSPGAATGLDEAVFDATFDEVAFFGGLVVGGLPVDGLAVVGLGVVGLAVGGLPVFDAVEMGVGLGLITIMDFGGLAVLGSTAVGFTPGVTGGVVTSGFAGVVFSRDRVWLAVLIGA